jgi:tetratricopeptide (TPR) repeat protein
MNGRLGVALLGAVLLLGAAPVRTQDDVAPAPASQEVQNPFKPFDRAAWEAHVKATLGATDAQLQRFAQQVDEVGVSRAADDLLRALAADYDHAVKQSEAGDPKAALALAQVLAATKDAVLGGHVRYHLARVFLDGDDPDRAVEILNEYLQQNINRTPLDAEAAFFYAQALAEIPRPDYALPRFRAFLRWFPDASERFRATAQQRIGELERQQDSRLHTLADGMKKVTRDLKKQKTDKPVQVEQQEFIEELNELIEIYEQLEKQGGGSPSGNQQSSGPANNSALPEGEARIGSLEKRVTLADRWGDLREKDRKEVESAVTDSLPPQYRKMLEEYYKKLGTTSKQ